MIIEKLYHNNREFVVVISEVVNRNALTSNQLVGLVSDLPDGVLAAQFLRSNLIVAPIYLIAAAQNALNSWLGNYAHSRSLSVEIAVYASAQKQISNALQAVGVEKLPESVALVAIGEDKQNTVEYGNTIISKVGPEKSPLFEQSEERFERIKKHFGVTDTEIQTIAESESLQTRFDALTRCLVSKVSLVAFET